MDLGLVRQFSILLTLCSVFALGSKLNVPRVLLPISPKTPVNFTLEVSDGGCYTWSSSRPEAVRIIPIVGPEECSRKAVVTSAVASSHKMSAIVLAREQSTGEIFRCDVIVNHIHTLQIAMKTRELFIEDAPEEFYARATDDQGNEFSSVDGLLFRWTFEGHSTDVDSSNEPVLRWVKFSDSSYEVMPSIATLETLGYQGHVILIEGMRTGSAKVSVRLEDEFFKNVPTVDVNIVVVANLVLDPPEIYLLPGSVVPLRLSQIKQGRPEVIPLPSSQYYLEVDDKRVAQVLDNMGSIKALQRGTTNARLRDRNMKEPDVQHAPFVTIHVVYPRRMSLALLPERSWATVLDRAHAIQVDLFDEHGNFIQPNDNLSVEVNVPAAFQVESATRNGTYHSGKAVKLGVHKVKATLTNLKLADGSEIELSPVLKASADLEVFDGISVIPAKQVLAWDPVTQPRREIKYKSTDGLPPHHFVSSNTSFAAVSQAGVAKTLGTGWCHISAFVPKYPHIRGDASLYVLPALSMDILPDIVEIEQGNTVNVPVKMTTRLPTGEEEKFSDCTDVFLTTELSDSKSFQIDHHSSKAAAKANACRSVPVKASDISVTKLTLKFRADDSVVEDSVVLSSYRKLRCLEPATLETVLALGSSRVLVFEGGPLPWVNKPSAHYRKIRVENETVASVGHLTTLEDDRYVHNDVYRVEVVCRQVGETEVTYRVGNGATQTNAFPVQASVQVKVACAHPSEIRVIPDVRLPSGVKTPCQPEDSPVRRIAVQAYLDLKLITTVLDDKGRKLDNFSSVQLNWSLSRRAAAQINSEGILMETELVDGYPVLGRSYQLLQPSGDQVGLLDVTARISGYKESVLRQLHLTSQPAIFPDSAAETVGEEDSDRFSHKLPLELVHDIHIEPVSGTTLFNHPNNQLQFRLVGGSGRFQVDYQPRDVARLLEYNAANRSLKIAPLSNGDVRVTVKDLCLWTRSTAETVVHVVSILRIDLHVSDKIEQGSSVPMTVRLYDTLEQPLDSSLLPFVQLQPVLGSSIVRVKVVEGLEHMVEGLALGETTIAFTASGVRSQVVNVQVFAPLKISPRNVTLVLGATLQVATTGGPQSDTVVEYSLEDEQVATCTPNGIINGVRLGHSVLFASAVGLDRHSGKQRVFSKDQVNIHVIRLSGVRIAVPLTRVRQDTEMPVYLTGLTENETPFAFGTCNPPLNVDWVLSDHLSGQILSPWLHSGIDPRRDNGNNFAVRFRALQPGQTLLKVRVTANQTHGRQLQLLHSELTDEVSIQVFESLQLTSPFSTAGSALVLMPDTEVNLRTNLDSSASIEYVVEGASDVFKTDGKGNFRSGASLGHASIVATAVNNYGVAQSLSTLVEVRSVSYFMLNASPLWSLVPGSHLSGIPRGFELELRLSYRDALGRSFHGVRGRPSFRPSRYDLMRISYDTDNFTLTVYADKTGQTVLHMSDELNPTLHEFLRFDVVDVIKPHGVSGVRPQEAGLIIGDVICFSAPVLPFTGSSGRWAADAGVLDVDPDSGVAIVVGAGATEVSFSISKKQVTSTDITTSSPYGLRFEEVADKVVTDARRSGQAFPLTLRLNGGNSLVGDNCSAEAISRFLNRRPSALTCVLSFTAEKDIHAEDLLSVSAEFDPKTGHHQCVVKSNGNATAVNSIVDTDVVLRAQYADLMSTQQKLRFNPAVYVQTPEVHVSDLQPATYLVITGRHNILRQLEFTSSDSSALTIYSATHPSPTTIKIPIRFNPGYYSGGRTSSLAITLRSPLTGQQADLTVGVKLFGDQVHCAPDASWLSIFSSLWNFCKERAIIVLSLLGACFLAFLVYRATAGSTSYRSTSNPVVFLQPNGSSESSGFISPFKRGGPQLWSVDNDTPGLLHNSGAYPRSPLHSSPNAASASPLLQRRRSPY